MTKTAKLFLPIVLVLMLILTNCQNQAIAPDGDPLGVLASYQGCKAFLESGTGQSLEPDPTKECLQYNYKSEGVLELNHINAGFNCCPGNIFSDITITDHTILIEEREQESGCYCLCLFDVHYRFENLPPGRYLVRVKGPCTSDDDLALNVLLELYVPCSGISCVDRTRYPWGS